MSTQAEIQEYTARAEELWKHSLGTLPYLNADNLEVMERGFITGFVAGQIARDERDKHGGG